uniref:C2H2-type domain-containing protein n=1 Tax=Panagrolaimus superbus TaxID=310955 RepID=A0A914YD15_9BILA
MLFFFWLLFFFQPSECSNDFGKGSKLTKEQISALPIPDLSPYDSTGDPLAALNSTQKIYIQSLFSKSIYYQKCDKPPKPIIQPIYFWPGKRIDLLCRMCLRSFAYNGLIKHWTVLRHGISDEISNIISKKTIKNEKWEIIDQKFSDDFVSYSQAEIPLMPQREKGNDSGAAPKEAYRPRTQFFQRDGKLIILHPHMDSYVHQCRSRNAKTEFRYLDEFHQFHFLPAILPKQNDICPITRFAAASSSQDYCSVDTFNEISQPSLNNIVNVSLFEHEGDQKFMAEKINLKIFISWSKWSSCNGGEAMKTRYGKQLLNGVLADVLNPYGHNSTHCNDYSYRNPLWDEIQNSIINLIKAVTKDTISEIRGRMTPDLNDLYLIESVCLRNINKYIKATTFTSAKNISIEYGQKIIQNEPC